MIFDFVAMVIFCGILGYALCFMVSAERNTHREP